MVEDDKTIALGLEYTLGQEGFAVTVCLDVESAMAALASQEFALLVLDVGLPDGSGYDVCKAAKAKADIPVIFLTAYDDEGNVVMGFDIGADDYVTKPFGSGAGVADKDGPAPHRRSFDCGSEINLAACELASQAKVVKNGEEIPDGPGIPLTADFGH